LVIIRTDSKGFAEHLVSAASDGLKVLPFDIDPELQYFSAIRMVSVILRTAVLAVAGNARRSLEWILPTSYRGRQEENEENRKYFGRSGVSLRDLIRTRFNVPTLCPRKEWIAEVGGLNSRSRNIFAARGISLRGFIRMLGTISARDSESEN
jgi:hypothetical protein